MISLQRLERETVTRFIRGDRLLHASACPVQVALHRAFGNAELRSDVGNRTPLGVESLNDLALPRIQALHRPLDEAKHRSTTLLPKDRLGGLAAAIAPRLDEVAVVGRPHLLKMVDEQPSADREEPRAEAEARIEAIDASDHPDEGLLNEILRKFRATAAAKQEGVQRRLMAPDERLDRGRIARLGPLDQPQFLFVRHGASVGAGSAGSCMDSSSRARLAIPVWIVQTPKVSGVRVTPSKPAAAIACDSATGSGNVRTDLGR